MGKPATTDTREIIVEILLDLEKGQDFSHKLIKAVLDKYDYLDPRDKAFIKRVTEGTIERQLELDYYLNRFSSVPVRKMKPLIRCLLRMVPIRSCIWMRCRTVRYAMKPASLRQSAAFVL